MIRRVLLSVLILSLSSMTLTGCWDRIEINDVAIVMATSFDKTKDGQYSVAVQMAIPGNMGGSSGGGGGGSSGQKPYYVDSDVGKTIREANDRLQARLSRRLYFAHRRILVVGDELAREGIREIFDVVARVPENRLTANMVIAKGEGVELLRAQPQFEQFSAEAMREIVESEAVVNARLKDVAHDLGQTGFDPLIPYMDVVNQQGGEEKSKEVQVVGYAQFRDDKMVDSFEGDAMKGIAWLRPHFHPYSATIGDKKIGKATLQLYKGETKIDPILKKDHVHFNVRVEARAYGLEALSSMDLARDENVRRLEKALDKQVHASIETALNQMKDKQTDVAGLGMLVSRNYPGIWTDKLSKNWHEQIPKITATIQVDTRISRIGQITENIAKREESPK
ncbi:MAG TPA: Ger(x)C family spore germination protein [Bacilli bacterium]|nr:Ger(x)C family spore germination protein [Bacilli bacterium]